MTCCASSWAPRRRPAAANSPGSRAPRRYGRYWSRWRPGRSSAASSSADDQVVRVVDHLAKDVVLDRTVEIDGVPVLLVQVIARTHGRIARPPRDGEARIAFQAHVSGTALQ